MTSSAGITCPSLNRKVHVWVLGTPHKLVLLKDKHNKRTLINKKKNVLCHGDKYKHTCMEGNNSFSLVNKLL